jgi:Trk-type K+ transport system membrane component
MVSIISNEVKWCATLGVSFSCFGDKKCLVTRVLSWHFLELEKKICTLLGFFLFPCFLLAKFLEEYNHIFPPPSLSLLIVEKYFPKVSMRSKRVYTLLDFTLLGLLSQGSKRAYTP